MTLLKTKTLPLKAGVDTSDATATASDILLGKTAYTADGKVTGTYNKLQQLVDGSIITITAEDLAGVTSIRSNAFRGLSSLVNIEFPNTLTTIGAGAFYECQNLESRIVIPIGNTTIGNYTFYRCFKVPEIVVSEGVSSIGYGAIQECTMITSITLPSTITNIGGNALYSCTALTGITILATTPPTLESIGAFQNTNNCPIYVPVQSLNAYKTATNWSSFASRIQPIPSEGLAFSVANNEATVTAIGDCTDTFIVIPSTYQGNPVTATGLNAFIQNQNIVGIYFPGSVKTIGQNTCNGCRGLESIIFSEGNESIVSSSFYACTGMTGRSLTLPSTINHIGSDAFGYVNYASVTILATTPPVLDDAAAFDVDRNYPIYVPAASVDAYKTATNWSALASRIQAIP